MLIHVNDHRRRLLGLAVAAAATSWLPRSAWSQQPTFTSNPFALGVASGSPAHDSVVLWTRLVGDIAQPVTVRWEVAHDERFARIVQSGQHQAVSELAHSVHAEVRGLEPDRWYFYRFMAGGAVSPVGRTRTFPAPDAPAAKLRIGYASCQRWEHGYFSAWRHMREENVDAVLFLGDYIYEYPGAGNPVRLPDLNWTLGLADYRRRHALYKSEPELQAMHAAAPWMVTWDDHEVQNDYAGTNPGDSGPRVWNFLERRAAAYQAFYEHMPLRASALVRAVEGLASGAEMRLYSKVRFGQLAQIVLLDDRQYRDPQACNGGKPGSSHLDPATCAAWDDPSRTLLGAPQERWFDAAMGEQQPTWTVIAQQTVFGPRDRQSGPARMLWNDAWDGYSAARKRFTESLLRHKVANPVLLGGDVHENWVGHVHADYAKADSPAIGVEFCGTSITSRSGGNERIAGMLAENPHFVFADSQGKGYGVIDFDAKGLATRLRVVDDVTKRDAGVRTLAGFAVAAGRPKLERL